jgi:hypothetical protein
LIIFNELDYAKKLINKGFIQKSKRYREILILSKFYFSLGLTEEEVIVKMTEFCFKYIKDFDKDFDTNIDKELLNSAITKAQKSKLKNVKPIKVSENEINIIDSMKTLEESKLLFSLLVLYKWNNCFPLKIKLSDLFEIANVEIDKNYRSNILFNFSKQGLIKTEQRSVNEDGTKKKNKERGRSVLFAEKNTENCAKITIYSIDSNFITYYLKHRGENYSVCVNCNKLIKKTSNPQKYCATCASEIEQQRLKRVETKRQQDILNLTNLSTIKCLQCGTDILKESNTQKYCGACALEKDKEKYIRYNKKRKKKS